MSLSLDECICHLLNTTCASCQIKESKAKYHFSAKKVIIGKKMRLKYECPGCKMEIYAISVLTFGEFCISCKHVEKEFADLYNDSNMSFAHKTKSIPLLKEKEPRVPAYIPQEPLRGSTGCMVKEDDYNWVKGRGRGMGGCVIL